MTGSPQADRHDINEAAGAYFQSQTPENLERVVQACDYFVKYFRRLYGGCASPDDLYQAGMEGVLKALKEFQPDRGASFSTYAGHKIMGEIRHQVRKEASYRRPGSISHLQFRIDALIEKVLQETGEMPSPEEVAERLGIRVQGVIEVMRAGLVSFDEIDVEAIHSTAYRSFELPIEDRLVLEGFFQSLNDMQKRIWDLLFVKHYTQEKAARELGMTQRQVSRAKEKMIGAFQDQVRENGSKKKKR